MFVAMVNDSKKIKVAILDLYEGKANQGMRCIREILNTYSEVHDLDIAWDEFDVRLKNEVPDMSYDIFISSGGPGSPLSITLIGNLYDEATILAAAKAYQDKTDHNKKHPEKFKE